MKIYIFFLFSFFSFFCFELYAEPFDPKQAVWKIHNSKVQGSGFIFEEKFLVTNHHVAKALLKEKNPVLNLISYVRGRSIEDKNIVLSQEGGSSVLKVKGIVDWSYPYDLAVLEIEGEVTNSLKLRSSPLRNGESVFMLGYPGGVLREIPSRFSSEDKLYYNFQIPVPDSAKDNVSGASGSPVLDSEGRVIGVFSRSAIYNDIFTNLRLEELRVIKISYLKRLIQNNRRRLEFPILIVQDFFVRKIRHLRESYAVALQKAEYELAVEKEKSYSGKNRCSGSFMK